MCLFIFSLDDCQSLNKWCDQLINFEVTREELLSHELEVDSTTENKSAPLKKKRKVLVEPEAGTKKNTQLVGAMAVKSRASEIFKVLSAEFYFHTPITMHLELYLFYCFIHFLLYIGQY